MADREVGSSIAPRYRAPVRTVSTLTNRSAWIIASRAILPPPDEDIRVGDPIVDTSGVKSLVAFLFWLEAYGFSRPSSA